MVKMVGKNKLLLLYEIYVEFLNCLMRTSAWVSESHEEQPFGKMNVLSFEKVPLSISQ
jgi:hypothetical protein